MKTRFAAGCSLASGLAVLALVLTSGAAPASTITSTFNGTSLADENVIWIGAPFSASGVGGGPATPYARNPAVVLGEMGQIALPNAVIRVLAVHATASLAREAWDVGMTPGSLGGELLADAPSPWQSLSRTADISTDATGLSLNDAAAPGILHFATGGAMSGGGSNSASATIAPQSVPAPWGSLVLMGAGLFLVRRRR